MKSSDQLMLESLYTAMYKSPNLVYKNQFNEQEIAKLLEQDLKTIEELIEEGFFGDMANKVKQGAGALAGKAKNAMAELKQGLTKTIVKKVVDLVMSKLNDQDKAKVFGMIADGKVDKKAVEELKQNIAGQQVQESFLGKSVFEDDKHFFVRTFFTEEILVEAIKESNFAATYDNLLTEVFDEASMSEPSHRASSAGAKTSNVKQGGNRPLRQAMQFTNQEADKLAAAIVAKLKELYGDNNRYTAQAVPKIVSGINTRLDKALRTKLGLPPSTASNNNGEQASPNNPEGNSSDAPNSPAETNGQQKPGFIQRLLKFVSNPKVYVTAGLAVAIIGFVAAIAGGAAVGPVLGIYATKMAGGAGAKVLWGAVGRKLQGKKIFDAKAIATDAGKGALMGAFAAGLGSIIAVVGQMLGGLFDKGTVSAQTGEVPSKGTIDQFPETHKTSFDNVSKLDSGKADFMDALKNRGIVGKGQWSDNASPAFTNAAGDMKLDSASYQKLADKIHGMSDSEISKLIQSKDAGNQDKAMQVAKDAILKLLGKK